MGPYLTVPKKEKEVQDGSNALMGFGACGMQGWRNTMEDSHIAALDLAPGIHFFGVYDGHGGNEVAEWVRDNLVGILANLDSFKAGDYELTMKELYIEIDKALLTPAVKKKLKDYSQPSQGGSFMSNR